MLYCTYYIPRLFYRDSCCRHGGGTVYHPGVPMYLSLRISTCHTDLPANASHEFIRRHERDQTPSNAVSDVHVSKCNHATSSERSMKSFSFSESPLDNRRLLPDVLLHVYAPFRNMSISKPFPS